MYRIIFVGFLLLSICNCNFADLNDRGKVIISISYNIRSTKHDEYYDFNEYEEVLKLWPKSKAILREEYRGTLSRRKSIISLYKSILEAKGYDDDDIDFFWRALRMEITDTVTHAIFSKMAALSLPPRSLDDLKYLCHNKSHDGYYASELIAKYKFEGKDENTTLSSWLAENKDYIFVESHFDPDKKKAEERFRTIIKINQEARKSGKKVDFKTGKIFE